jgi:excisionase family DNA binding protein
MSDASVLDLEAALARVRVVELLDTLRREDDLRREFVAALRDELRDVATAESAEKQWLTLDEAALRLGISRDAVRMRAQRGRLLTRNHGRRVYVSAASVDRLGCTA